MPEAKPGQLQQEPALLLEAPLQRRDPLMLGESAWSVPRIPPCSRASSIEVVQDCCLLPQSGLEYFHLVPFRCNTFLDLSIYGCLQTLVFLG